MITLSLLKQMENDNLGVIDTDLFHLEIPLLNGKPRDGAWILPRDAPVSRLNVDIQPFDIYFRHKNKNTSLKRAKQFLTYLQESYGKVCDLPSYPPVSTDGYSGVMITPVAGVGYVGEDINGKLVFVISGEVRYESNN